MASSSQRMLPSRLQSLVSSLLLIGLSFCLLPITLAATGFTLWSSRKQATKKSTQSIQTGSPKSSTDGSAKIRLTALVNGGRMQKCMFISRALAKQGWRVVVVEERGWGLLSPARFSSAVDKFILVPSGGGQKYINALVDVAQSEDVSLFVPCSGAGTTGEDAQAADIMRKRMPTLRAIIQDPELVTMLHEKDKFIDLVHSMGLDAPGSITVNSKEELIDLLKKPDQPPRILKCAADLDDIGRSDLTTYPLQNAKGSPDWIATDRRLSSLYIPITAKTPYIAQEFIGGEHTSEWCTHATIINGRIQAFVACPSNDMLMTYYPAHQHPFGKKALRWTQDFLEALIEDTEKWKGKSLDGHYSFDFIHQPDPSILETIKQGTLGRLRGSEQAEIFFNGGRIVAIECNPRVHTAVGLLTQDPHFGSAYHRAFDEATSTQIPQEVVVKDDTTSDLKKRRKTTRASTNGSQDEHGTVFPLENASPMSWLAHDLPARLLPLILPRFLRTRVHPLWLTEAEVSPPQINNSASSPSALFPTFFYDLNVPGTRDAAWDPEDPIPFLALYHLMWPYLLVRQIVGRRKGWSRINVSTARIFEC